MATFLSTGHTHEFEASTGVVDNHSHRIAAISSRPFLRTNGEHFHIIKTLTTFNDGHAHLVFQLTSNDIEIGNTGFHVHRLVALTSIDDGHRHPVNAFTQAAPNIPLTLVRQKVRKV